MKRKLIGPYTIVDLGYARQVWRHGWRDVDGVFDRVRNVVTKRDARRLPQ